ncbi:uncharacterized protein BDW43DRAFT_285185 [Aspergillus alliaceus]|uniref:uncharacterized protein n=1 Tax=Petromyces alliaceus TaxID=209559 RepID=UPI0012A47EA1|nr:uncharacterized protein BDW43DRAFT_285185 [Aspergillus alliaceus]KAB8230612.1 hypothetical protein BDW43DRAFT_285185 [Aspergillus alliaceus]
MSWIWLWTIASTNNFCSTVADDPSLVFNHIDSINSGDKFPLPAPGIDFFFLPCEVASKTRLISRLSSKSVFLVQRGPSVSAHFWMPFYCLECGEILFSTTPYTLGLW